MLKNLSRRNWLTASAAIAGSSLSPFHAHAQQGQVRDVKELPRLAGVDLAIATICTDGFGNQNHRPAFEFLPQSQFRNVEFNLWYPETITPNYIKGLQARCQQHQLVPVSLQGTSFGGEGRSGIIKDVSHKLLLMQYCRQLGCNIVKFTGAKRGSAGGLESVIAVCKELVAAAEEWGVLVVLENHAGNVLERIEDFESIFEQVESPNLGLCLDTGHFEGVDIDLHDVLDRLGKKTLHVDLKDCAQRGAGHNTVVFGEGVTDFDSFLQHLMETNYRGYLVIEQAWSVPKGDWKSDLNAAYRRFSRWQTERSD